MNRTMIGHHSAVALGQMGSTSLRQAAATLESESESSRRACFRNDELSDADLAAVSGSGLDSPLAQLFDTLDISWD